MWYVWIALTLVSCARGDETTAASMTVVEPQTTARVTTREPLRTLDRQAEELAWKSWLRSQENRGPNAPPRRLITKSLFIPPLICPKGQRFDRDGCVDIVNINRNEHERYLLDHLNALFAQPSENEEIYDYGDEDPGPLQVSIPIGMESFAAPLQGQEPSLQAQEVNPSQIEFDKRNEQPVNTDLGVEAELELLKLETNQDEQNFTATYEHKIIDNFLPYLEKPKRDSAHNNLTTDYIQLNNTTDNTTEVGQKEVVFGDVSIDPMLYLSEIQNKTTNVTIKINTEPNNKTIVIETQTTNDTHLLDNVTPKNLTVHENLKTEKYNTELQDLKNNNETSKINPESDSSNIGEAIKLISRYAEVTTDDNFAKDQKKTVPLEEGILGTRTKLQHRRNKLKPIVVKETPEQLQPTNHKEKLDSNKYPTNDIYYRYPWGAQHSPTPPPNYPFRHLQDYWPGRKRVGGIYNTGRENPRRHHHSFPHNTLRPHSYTDYSDYPTQYSGQLYPGQQVYPHRLVQRRANPSPARSHGNHDLYSLLGLRHWFSTDSPAKR